MVQIIRPDQPCVGPMGYHSNDLDFSMVDLTKDWARLCFKRGGEIRVEAGNEWYRPSGVKHEVLEIQTTGKT